MKSNVLALPNLPCIQQRGGERGFIRGHEHSMSALNGLLQKPVSPYSLGMQFSSHQLPLCAEVNFYCSDKKANAIHV